MGKRYYHSIHYTDAIKNKKTISSREFTQYKKLYYEALFNWNENLQRNLALLQRYFGNKISNHFEQEIQPSFRIVHTELVKKNPDYNLIQLQLDKLSSLVYNTDFLMTKLLQAGKVGVFNNDLTKTPQWHKPQ